MEDVVAAGNYVEWKLEESLRSGEHFMRREVQLWNIPIFCSISYLCLVFFGKKYMSNRQKYDLRQALMLWSSVLAVFSIVGTVRTWHLALDLYNKGGIKSLVCDTAFYRAPISHFWTLIFVYSKYVEYGDTFFIIMRKQRLIFLHWYHHVTVALFCWLCVKEEYAGGLIFMILNYAVHAFMYSYYALKAAGLKIPKIVAMVITTSQILQMVLGSATVASVAIWNSKDDCHATPEYLAAGGLMYVSYLALFIHFFYGAYMTKRAEKDPRPVGRESEMNGRDFHEVNSEKHNLDMNTPLRRRNASESHSRSG